MSNNKAWEKTDFTDRFSKTGKNRSFLRVSCSICGMIQKKRVFI